MDLDEYDEKVVLPQDPLDPCECTSQCSNKFCQVSTTCNHAKAQRNRIPLLGIPYGPKYMPCGNNDEVLREALRLHVDHSGRIYDPDQVRGGGASHHSASKKSKNSYRKKHTEFTIVLSMTMNGKKYLPKSELSAPIKSIIRKSFKGFNVKILKIKHKKNKALVRIGLNSRRKMSKFGAQYGSFEERVSSTNKTLVLSYAGYLMHK